MLKYALVGGALAAYAIKKYCDQKNKVKAKKIKNLYFFHNWVAVKLINI